MLPKNARQIRIAATLHDVGKLMIPETILGKPGKLTAREFEIIKAHTILGAEMLKTLQGDLGEMARLCCEFHHERFDGQGYWGRRIGDLPRYVSFVAISDVFTALASKRPYKEAWPPCEALQYIQNKSGTQFCPELVKIFLDLVRGGGSVPAILNGGK
jgi:putative two-component system response regulator